MPMVDRASRKARKRVESMVGDYGMSASTEVLWLAAWDKWGKQYRSAHFSAWLWMDGPLS